VLLDEQDARSRSQRVRAHDRQQALDDHRREAEAELVEQQQARLAHEGAPDGEHLLLAPGEQADAPRAQRRQGREVLVGALGVQALAAVAEAEVLGDGEAEEQPAALGDVRDPLAGQPGRPIWTCPRR
jgi:hypothetical protein